MKELKRSKKKGSTVVQKGRVDEEGTQGELLEER